MRILVLAVALAAAAALPAASGADNPQLVGTVGPGFTITLADSGGKAVQHLDAGTYDLVVHDLSDLHDFHLFGPGVDVATTVDFQGDRTFTVTLADGIYTFLCDPHGDAMLGKFTAGSVTELPKPKPQAPTNITARIGPGASIAFPAKLPPGRYSIAVRDLSSKDNLHLRGPGVNRRTGVAFRGNLRWSVNLVAGRYRAWSDAHPKLARTVTVS
jgi:hypothetical protein